MNAFPCLFITRIRMPYQVTLDGVLGDFVSDDDELFLGEVLGELVLNPEVDQDLARSRTPDSMDVLKRELDPLVVRNLHSSHTSAFHLKPPILTPTPSMFALTKRKQVKEI